MAPAWRNSYLRYKTYFLNISSQYSKREDVKMFLELLLSLATVSLFAVFAIRPTLITIAELFKEIQGKKTTVVQLDEKIKNLATAQTVYETKKDTISLLETAIPKEPKPDSFIRQVEGVIGQNTLKVLAINVEGATLLGTPKGEANVPEGSTLLPEGSNGLTFTLNVSSSYPTLSSFLADLERLRRPVKIDSLGFNLTTSEAGRELNLVVSGRTPYLRDSQVAQTQ
jgi:Tfp pilus assembly protein PilO